MKTGYKLDSISSCKEIEMALLTPISLRLDPKVQLQGQCRSEKLFPFPKNRMNH